MEQRTGSKLGKEYDKAVYCHRAYLTSMQNTSCKMPGWMRITSCNQDCWENTNNFRYAEWKSWLETQHSKNKEHGILSHHFMANRRRKIGSSDRFHFLAPKSLWTVSNCNREIKRHLLLGRKAMTNLESILKSKHCFANKSPYSQSYGFSSSHVWMWELDHKEGWAPKNWCFWTVVLEKTLESPLDCKEIKPVSPKGNQPWIFTGRTVAKAEAPVL